MPSRPHGDNSTWVIVAIPGGVIVLLGVVALILFAIRPAKQAGERPAVHQNVPPPPSQDRRVAAEPTKAPPAAPAAVEPTPAPPSVPTVSSAVPSNAPINLPSAGAATAPTALAFSGSSSSPPAAGSSPSSIDLLAALDLGASVVTGDWQKDGAAICCGNATAKNRAKLRLVPPPSGDGGYDFALTFTAEGERRMVAQVLSFRGRQFIFAMFGDQSGFASVHGKNARGNETTRTRGITASTKHTSLVKVRDHEVSAYLDGQLLSTYTTDYSDLDVAKAWNLGPSSTKQNVLGLAVECPVTIEAISLTPLEGQPNNTPALSSVSSSSSSPPSSPPSSYKNLATIISSPFSVESSAAATQPVAAGDNSRRLKPEAIGAIVATSQPVVSDVAAGLLQELGEPASGATRPAGIAGNDDADAFFRAVQLSISPAGLPSDPLLDSQPAERSSTALERGEFDTEQAQLRAWRTLIGRLSDLYPNAKPKSDLVKVHLAPGGGGDAANSANPAKGKFNSFFATHTNPEPLTDVTLAVEIVHAMTSPSPTAVHYYFIPRWPPGQKIFFPPVCIPNVSSRELLDDPAPSVPNGLGGMIEARAQLWSDKLAQPNQAISFDGNFPSVAHAQLDRAYALVDEALRRPLASSRPAATALAASAPAESAPAARASGLIVGPVVPPPRTDLTDDSPELARGKDLARRAQGLLAAQSSFADEAGKLASTPQAALRDLRKRQVDAFVTALPLHSSRSGVWVVHQPGMLNKLAKAADREAAVSAAGGASGRITLTIDSRTNDGSLVGVTLSSTDQPELRRKFTGRLQVDASANRVLLSLRATQPPPSRPPAEGDLKRVIYWNSLLLEPRGNALCGIGAVGPPEATTVVNVALGAPTAAAAAPPAPTNSKPPPRPRPTTARAK